MGVIRLEDERKPVNLEEITYAELVFCLIFFFFDAQILFYKTVKTLCGP